LSISQIVSSFNYKSYKKLLGRIRTDKRSGKRIFPGRRGNRPHKISFACLCVSRRKSRQQAKQNSGAARGAAPLWKFAKQIWFEAEGRNPTVGCFRIVWRVVRIAFQLFQKTIAA
jgi:hypothetical protein